MTNQASRKLVLFVMFVDGMVRGQMCYTKVCYALRAGTLGKACFDEENW